METPFACNLSALTASQRARHQQLGRELLAAVLEIQELPDGYAARLPSDSDSVLRAAEFITLERLCCPFLSLAVELVQNQGPVWLRITGAEGVKPFIRAEFKLADRLKA